MPLGADPLEQGVRIDPALQGVGEQLGPLVSARGRGVLRGREQGGEPLLAEGLHDLVEPRDIDRTAHQVGGVEGRALGDLGGPLAAQLGVDRPVVTLGVRVQPPDPVGVPGPVDDLLDPGGPLRRVHADLHQPSIRNSAVAQGRREVIDLLPGSRPACPDHPAEGAVAAASPHVATDQAAAPQRADVAHEPLDPRHVPDGRDELAHPGGELAARQLDLERGVAHPVEELGGARRVSDPGLGDPRGEAVQQGGVTPRPGPQHVVEHVVGRGDSGLVGGTDQTR